jgi:hypothetical protein
VTILAEALRARAGGILTAEAGISLLIDCGGWLHRGQPLRRPDQHRPPERKPPDRSHPARKRANAEQLTQNVI